jgi:hypothetical protein
MINADLERSKKRLLKPMRVMDSRFAQTKFPNGNMIFLRTYLKKPTATNMVQGRRHENKN